MADVDQPNVVIDQQTFRLAIYQHLNRTGITDDVAISKALKLVDAIFIKYGDYNDDRERVLHSANAIKRQDEWEQGFEAEIAKRRESQLSDSKQAGDKQSLPYSLISLVHTTMDEQKLRLQQTQIAHDTRYWVKNHVKYLIWIAILLVIYAGLAAWMILFLKDELVTEVVGWPIYVAKICAQTLKFTFLLLPLFMLKSLTTMLAQHSLFNKVIPVDKFLTWHKLAGQLAIVLSAIHVVANAYIYSYVNGSGQDKLDSRLEEAKQEDDQDLIESLKSIENRIDTTYAYSSEPFITGVLLSFFLFALWLYASPMPRHLAFLKKTALGKHLNNYNNFIRTHLGYIPIYILLFLHVIPGIPSSAFNKDVWVWLTPVVLLFGIEKAWTWYKLKNVAGQIVHVDLLPGNMMMMTIQKPEGFRFTPGMYMNIRYPGDLQVHPFTISASPQDSTLRLHIKVVGDWTNWLKEQCLRHTDLAGIDMATKGDFPTVNNNPRFLSRDSAISVGHATLQVPQSVFQGVPNYRDTVQSTVPEAFGSESNHEFSVMTLYSHAQRQYSFTPSVVGQTKLGLPGRKPALKKQSSRRAQHRSKSAMPGAMVKYAGGMSVKSASMYRSTADNSTGNMRNAYSVGVPAQSDRFPTASSVDHHTNNEISQRWNQPQTVEEDAQDIPQGAQQHPETGKNGEEGGQDSGQVELTEITVEGLEKQPSAMQSEILTVHEPVEKQGGSDGEGGTEDSGESSLGMPPGPPVLNKASLAVHQAERATEDAAQTIIDMYLTSNVVQNFNSAPSPLVYIDGPYTTPLSKYNRYKLSILVANGSGLSPFLSMIRSRLTQESSENRYQGYTKGRPWDRKDSRLVFVWVIRDWEWLSWIENDLDDLLRLASEPSKNVQLVVYITGAGAADLERASAFYLKGDQDLELPSTDETCVDLFHKEYTQHLARKHGVTFHCEKGRPDWSKVLQRLLAQSPKEERRECGVFTCGVKAMCDELEDLCAKGLDVEGLRYKPRYFTEQFY